MNIQREQTYGWVKTRFATSEVCRPTSIEDIQNMLIYAQAHERTVVSRGAGHSYTDAMLNDGGITLDLSQMQRVLSWNPQQGILQVEPGVTIDTVWKTTVSDGWWMAAHPSVLSATLGGCISMHAHGTNAWKQGAIGEHVLAMELLLASGEKRNISPTENSDLFYAVIGGMGMLGIVTSIKLQLRRIRSGNVRVQWRRARSLSEMFAIFADETPDADYLEGWIDGQAAGHHLGRGFIRRGNLVDLPDVASLQLKQQVLSENVASILPPALVGKALRPVFNDISVKIGNQVLYVLGGFNETKQAQYLPIAHFHFSNNSMYRALETLFPRGGQGFQPCVPAEHAPDVFKELFERSQRAEIPPFWCWFKQHRSDPFMLTYQVDGFSLDLAYRITQQNAQPLIKLLEEMRQTVVSAGGRLYLAKDGIVDAQSYIAMMGRASIERFLATKHTYDPEWLFQSDLFRRVFAGAKLLHEKG